MLVYEENSVRGRDIKVYEFRFRFSKRRRRRRGIGYGPATIGDGVLSSEPSFGTSCCGVIRKEKKKTKMQLDWLRPFTWFGEEKRKEHRKSMYTTVYLCVFMRVDCETKIRNGQIYLQSTTAELSNVSLISTSPYLKDFLEISGTECSLSYCNFDVLDTSPEDEDASGVNIVMSSSSAITVCKSPRRPRCRIHFLFSNCNGGGGEGKKKKECVTKLSLMMMMILILLLFWGEGDGWETAVLLAGPPELINQLNFLGSPLASFDTCSDSPTHNAKQSLGAIVGIVLGSIAFMLVAIVAIVYLKRKQLSGPYQPVQQVCLFDILTVSWRAVTVSVSM